MTADQTTIGHIMNHRRTGKVARLPEKIRNQLLLREDSKTDNQPVQNSPTTDNQPI